MKKRITKTIQIIISCLLVLGLFFVFIPFIEKVNKSAVEGSNNWMSKIDDSILLSDINIPGTHDSATEHIELAFFSRCQDLSIREQLEGGIRYLDIRLGIENEQMKLMHSFTSAKKSNFIGSNDLFLEDILTECYDFLDKNPTETILFMVKQEYGDESTVEFENLLYSYIKENRDDWYLTNELPTLKEVRGKLVLMRRYEDEANLGNESGIDMRWQEPEDCFVSQDVYEGYQLNVQDMYELNVEEKWNAFQEFLNDESSKDAVKIHFLSTKGSLTYGHPYYFAKILNQRFLDMKLDSKKYGWIILDFANPRLAEHIYSTNFNK